MSAQETNQAKSDQTFIIFISVLVFSLAVVLAIVYSLVVIRKRMRAKHNGLSLSPSLSKGSREERRISLGLDGPDGQKKKQARQMKFGKSVVQPQLDTVAEV